MGRWEDYQSRVADNFALLKDRDYMRWRRKRRLVRLGLVVLSMVLLSPLLLVFRGFQVRSVLGFACLLGSVCILLMIYRLLGWIGRGYTPPAGTQPTVGEPVPGGLGTAPGESFLWVGDANVRPEPSAAATEPVMATAVPETFTARPAPPTVATMPVAASDPPPAASSSGCGVGVVIVVIGLMTILFCGGVVGLGGWMLLRHSARGVQPGAPFPRPVELPRPGMNEHLQRLQREQQERMEQMRRDQERRMQEMQRRQQEMLDRMRPAQPTP